MPALPLPLAQAGLSALNHVLRQQAWARDRLKEFTGRTVRIQMDLPIGPAQTDARIALDGTLEVTATEPPAVTLLLRPSLDTVFTSLREGPQVLASEVKIEGDALLAAALGEIAQHLRWDVEEDLSRVVGDVLAYRVAGTARELAAQSASLRDRVQSGLRQALIDDTRQLVDRLQAQALARELADLDMRLARLEAAAGAR